MQPTTGTTGVPSSSPRYPSPWIIATFLVAAVYLPFTLNADIVGFGPDDAIYLLMADFFAAREPGLPMLHYVRSASHFPPLYSLLLAVCGAGSDQLDIAHLVQTTTMTAAVLMWGLAAARLSNSRAVGILTLLTLATLPQTLLFSTEIWSEFLYLLLLGGAVVRLLAAEQDAGQGLPNSLLVAALIGLAAITRGFGLVAVIALIVTTAWHRPRHAMPVGLVALVPLIAAHSLELGGGTIYLDIFAAKVTDLASLVAVLSANITAGGAAVVSLFSTQTDAFAVAAAATVLLLALPALLARLVEVRFDAVYTLGYVALLVIWPFPEVSDRLLYPLAPLLLIYAVLGAKQLARTARADSAWAAGPATASVFLTAALAGSVPLVGRYLEPLPDPALGSFRASRYWLAAADPERAVADIQHQAAMRRLMLRSRADIPVDACVYARHPQAVMFYTRRPSWLAPVGDHRPARPACEFHILLTNETVAKAAREMWSGYRIVRTEHVADGVAGILVRYLQFEAAHRPAAH